MNITIETLYHELMEKDLQDVENNVYAGRDREDLSGFVNINQESRNLPFIVLIT